MDSSGTLYSGDEAKAKLQLKEELAQLIREGNIEEFARRTRNTPPPDVIEITKEQFDKYSTMTQEERAAEYKRIADFNEGVNTRQVRRQRERSRR